MPFQKGNTLGHRFNPGEIGNPYGRPKGFSTQIQRLCGKDYRKTAEGLRVVAFGNADQCERFFGEPIRRTVKDRLAAMVELRDSGPGRPAQAVPSAGPENQNIVIRWLS
jgi:hypothetical protein